MISKLKRIELTWKQVVLSILFIPLTLFLFIPIVKIKFAQFYRNAQNDYYASALDHVVDYVELLRCKCEDDKETIEDLRPLFHSSNLNEAKNMAKNMAKNKAKNKAKYERELKMYKQELEMY